MRLHVAIFLSLALAWPVVCASPQDRDGVKPENPKTEPKYDDTFAGSIIELSASKITVSRSILGKPAEKHQFLIDSETRIEGKMRLKSKVTVGFIRSEQGDQARLIVVRQRPEKK